MGERVTRARAAAEPPWPVDPPLDDGLPVESDYPASAWYVDPPEAVA